MKNLGILGIVVATTVTAVFPLGNRLSAKPNATAEAATNQEVAKSTVPSRERDESSEQDLSALPEDKADADTPETPQAKSKNAFSALEHDQFGRHQEKFDEHADDFSVRDYSPNNLSFHPYVALPGERKPAEIVLDSLKGVPIGTPLEEIKRASDVFGLDFSL
jgi:hypothetical protein